MADDLSLFTPPNPIPSILRQPADEYALPTDTSKLMKFLNALNAPGNATNNAQISLLRGGQPKDVAQSYKKGLTLQQNPSGANVMGVGRLTLENIMQNLSNKFMDKIAPLVIKDPEELKKYYSTNNQSKVIQPPTDFRNIPGEVHDRFNFSDLVGGLAHDIADPTNPINYIGLGELTNAGKYAKSLTRAGEEGLNSAKLAKGIGNQMQKGQRSLASLGKLQTPNFINKPVGKVVNYVGGAISSAIPEVVKDAITPAFNILRTSQGYINNAVEKFVNSMGLGSDLEKTYNPVLQKAVKSIQSNPKEVLGPMHSYYVDELHLNPLNKGDAKIIAEKEAIRHGETPILQSQKAPTGEQDELKDILNPERVNMRLKNENVRNQKINSGLSMSNMKVQIMQRQLGIEKYKLNRGLAVKGEKISLSPLENALNQEKGNLNRLVKQKSDSDQIIKDLGDKYKILSKPNSERLATAQHNLNILNDPRFESPVHPTIQKMTDILKSKYSKLAGHANKANIPMPLIDINEYMGRKLSPEAQKATLNIGNSGGTLFNKLNTSPRVLRNYTTEQGERMFANPFTRQTMFEKGFGNEPLQQKRSVLQAISGKANKPGYLYETDPLKVLATKAQDVGGSVASLNEFKRLLQQGTLTKTRELNVPNAAKIEVPEQYQKALGGLKEVYAPESVRKEMAKPQGLYNESDNAWKAINKTIGTWKKNVLFATPIMGTGIATKYIEGHSRIADANKAFTVPGVDYATQAMKPFFQRQGLMEKGLSGQKSFEQALDKIPGIPLSEAKGIDPKNPAWKAYIKPDGSFNLAKLFEDRGGASEGGYMDLEGNPGGIHVTSKGIGKGISKASGTDISTAMAKSADAFSRLQYAASRIIKDGYAPDVALDEARKNLYDYTGGLSPFEQKYARTALPFYSWLRLNTPSMGKNLIKNPSIGTKLVQTKKNIEATYGKEPGVDERFLNQFVNENPHIRTAPDEYMNLVAKDPLSDLEGFSSPKRGLQTIMGALNPIAKILMELNTNQSDFYRKPGGEPAEIERYPGETGNFLGMNIPKKYINVATEAYPALSKINSLNPFGIFGQNRGQKELTTSEKFSHLFDWGKSPADKEKEMTNAKAAYNDALRKYKSVQNQASKNDDDKTVDKMQKLIDKLNERAIPIESDKQKRLFTIGR